MEGENIPGTLIAASLGGIQINRQSNQVIYYEASGQMDTTVNGPQGTDGVGASEEPNAEVPPPPANGGDEGNNGNEEEEDNENENPVPAASATPSPSPAAMASMLPSNNSCTCRLYVLLPESAQVVNVTFPTQTSPVTVFAAATSFIFNGYAETDAQCGAEVSTDDVQVAYATVAITVGMHAGQDSLQAASNNDVTISNVNAHAVIQPRTGTYMTLTTLLRALANVQYANSHASASTATTVTPGRRTLTVSVTDIHGCASMPITVHVNVATRGSLRVSDASATSITTAAAFVLGAAALIMVHA